MAGEGRPAQIHLSSALAQRIVDELAPAIHENVNLMDVNGFIIASSDESRLGALHPGAREAATTGEAVDVHEQTVRSGERPGVNLPLEYRGRVIGVVGVTGAPEKVRSLAPVLSLTIALLFERESELAGESSRDAEDRDVIARLVYGSRPLDAISFLSQRGRSLSAPWVIAAGLAPEGALDAAALNERPVTQLRRALGPGAVVGVLRGVVWVLASDAGRGSAEGTTRTDSRGAATEVGERIAARINGVLPGASVMHTALCASDEDLAREAGHLAELAARSHLWRDGVQAANSRYLDLAAAQLPAGVMMSLAAVLDGVTSAERETLVAYLESGVAAELSRSGYTHRNTVRRRLQSIADRTGFDIRVPEQAAVLALAIAAEREFSGARGAETHK